MLGIGLNSQIAFSANEIYKSIYNSTHKINKNIEAGFISVKNAIDKNSAAVNGLNRTFDDEFNNPEKRTIQIIFQNEEGEDEKLSKLFKQVPLFKDELLEGFNKYPEEISAAERYEIYKEIDNDENLPLIFSCWADPTFEKEFKYIFKYDFEESYPHKDTPITLPKEYNDKIPWYLYSHILKNIRCVFDFWNYLEAFREYLNKKIDNGVAKETWQANKDSYRFFKDNMDKFIYTAEMLAFARDWNPTKELKKKINDSIAYRKNIIDYYLKKFNSPLENFIIDLVEKYKKEELNIEINNMSSSKIILTINNYFLIIKRAPNVNVGNGDF